MDSYITPEKFTEWAAARGHTIAEPAVLLTKALDYMALLPWVGDKVNPEQVLDWPRVGVPGVAADATPKAVVDAQCRLALAAVSADLMPNTGGPQVVEKNLSGVGLFRYAEDTLGAGPSFPWLVPLLAGLVGSASAVTFPVRRG